MFDGLCVCSCMHGDAVSFYIFWRMNTQLMCIPKMKYSYCAITNDSSAKCTKDIVGKYIFFARVYIMDLYSRIAIIVIVVVVAFSSVQFRVFFSSLNYRKTVKIDHHSQLSVLRQDLYRYGSMNCHQQELSLKRWYLIQLPWQERPDWCFLLFFFLSFFSFAIHIFVLHWWLCSRFANGYARYRIMIEIIKISVFRCVVLLSKTVEQKRERESTLGRKKREAKKWYAIEMVVFAVHRFPNNVCIPSLIFML